ncbi:DinB family protein [Streptomyces sp. NPDC015232]|uniref:DinB family protein n=1 Tax=unclassified Streptomyces TaxID=2593676 RepID=UPI0036FF2837
MESGAGGWQGPALGLFRRVRVELAAALDCLDAEALDWRPVESVNSVGWLAWHIARGQDRNLSEMAGLPQLWVTEGWARRCGRPADPGDTGFGHSATQAAAFRSPSGELLLAYQAAVHDRAEGLLRAAPEGDLARVVASPTLGNTHTVEERLRGLVADSFAHLGQISLVRALFPAANG